MYDSEASKSLAKSLLFTLVVCCPYRNAKAKSKVERRWAEHSLRWGGRGGCHCFSVVCLCQACWPHSSPDRILNRLSKCASAALLALYYRAAGSDQGHWHGFHGNAQEARGLVCLYVNCSCKWVAGKATSGVTCGKLRKHCPYLRLWILYCKQWVQNYSLAWNVLFQANTIFSRRSRPKSGEDNIEYAAYKGSVNSSRAESNTYITRPRWAAWQMIHKRTTSRVHTRRHTFRIVRSVTV